ncbi:MAG TPA: 4Fe-4S dicluster domain-containing protein [Symbiobacteriaceae bacterium]|jgi:formate dehydrogenase iron-sulfur subunit|nr:4Fe-4S dicluster domain-containing protein [Symbiobacteriaceae bacterium]
MGKGMLIDLTKCMGCRGCQVACKQWNNLQAVPTEFSAEFTNPPVRSAYTWTTIEFLTTEVDGKTLSTFTKQQCMHCEHPACESVCIAAAIKKTDAGPVTIDYDKCIGCRYCQVACPFGVPKYQYDKVTPKMQKCTMCADRIEAGLETACAATCPSGAIKFGERSDLLKMARERIAKGNGKYIDHIYGEEEAGGTAVLYLSGVPLDLTKLKQGVTEEAVPNFTWKAMKQLPALLGVVGLSSLGLMAYSSRRNAVAEAEAAAGKGAGKSKGGKQHD